MNETMKNRLIVVLSAVSILLLVVASWAVATRDNGKPASPTYWVATDGNDAAAGTSDAPWATLQKAADSVPPGATVYVRGGTYAQRVDIHVSGEPGQPITFAPAPGEAVVLDGSSLDVPAGQSAMIGVDSQRYVTIQGFEITGYRSDASGHVPIGILVTGAADHVRLDGNFVHDLGTTFKGRNGGDAHGIGVFGTTGDHPIAGVEVVDNELANLTLGSSEALVVNGNVTDFLIQGNQVHDTNNIGIDVIGFEGTAPDPTVDQARDGVVQGNTVWNVDSYGNPAYGYDRSADGIYVDGGRDVLIEGNVVHDINIGIELASEHAGRATRNITARNNLVYDATAIGVAIGGYDRRRGSTEDCVIVNNTIVHTDGVELLVQFDTRNNVIANNVIVAGPAHRFVENAYRENIGNVVDHNLYYSQDGNPVGLWEWKGTAYEDFDAWQARLRERPRFDVRRPRLHRSGRGRLFAPVGLARCGRRRVPRRRRRDGSDRGAHGPRRGDRSRRLRGGGRAAVPHPVDGGTGHLRRRPHVAPIGQRVGTSRDRPEQRGARTRRRRASPDRHGRRSTHGIGAHAPSRIEVSLEGRCSLFLADVGLDEEVGDHGSVVFEVWGDDERLAVSGIVRGPQVSVPIAADVTGVDRMALVVTPGGDGNAFDHADWGNARLACES